MNKNWISLLFLFVGITAFTQCNYQLVEKAAQQAGSNTVFLREFKVRLTEASMDNPVPSGKFPVYLNQGLDYRFTIANAAEFNGKAIVELLRRGQVYASNIFPNNAINNTFDFTCERSATYQLQINFEQGLQGCAAIVMSLILQDSLSYIKPGDAIVSDSLETFYLWTKNQIQIATTLGKEYLVNASVSQGKIKKDGKFYIVQPISLGDLYVYVEITDYNGNFIEGDTVQYIVELPPIPQLRIPGEQSGTISLIEFTGIGDIQFEEFLLSGNQIYKLKNFSISKSSTGIGALVSYDYRLTHQQIMFIKSLSPGDSFFVTDILFIGPDNKIHRSINKQILIIK